MQPEQLKNYPVMARALVSKNIELLRRLPVPFASLLLREAIGYDWKFPMERREIENDFAFLNGASPSEFKQLMEPFRSIQLPAALMSAEWVHDPIAFTEKLSAHLWASHQIDEFRSTSMRYMDRRVAAFPPEPPAVPLLTMVLVGEGVVKTDLALFRKLRRHGTYFSNVEAKDGLAVLLRKVSDRAKAQPQPFAHWYIDGGDPAKAPEGVTSVSYGGLSAARTLLQRELKSSYENRVGSEAMRSQLAQKKPEDLGLTGTGDDAVRNRFALSILTEGSGTQIYSTTFVQWAAKEALRRAQPLTMVVRFRPRQRDRPMQELLLEAQRSPDLDPVGSLVDADMGAYYTWLNQQRLPGADRSLFFALFEGHRQAIAIGPAMQKGTTSDKVIELRDLVGA